MTKEFLKYGEEVQELAEKQLKETRDAIHEYYSQKAMEAEAEVDKLSDEEIWAMDIAEFKAKYGDNIPDDEPNWPEISDDDEE